MVVTALCVIGFTTGVAVSPALAGQWGKKTILTVEQPIQVTDAVLQQGQYVLKLSNSNANRHIVQVFNGDQSRIIDTVIAIPNYRLQAPGDRRFMFWETPPGAEKALRAWFCPCDNYGQEFRYPKQLAMLTTPAAPTAPQPAVTEPQPGTAPAGEQPQPQSMTQEPQEQQPVETAQNTPPPAPELPQQQQMPTTLAKSSSYYTIIGLSGLFSLDLYGLLRLKRTA